MLYLNIEQIIQVIISGGVKVVFTSAGITKIHAARLKENDITVVHVVYSVKFA